MKKHWLIAVLAIVALVGSACSSDDDDDTPDPTTTTTEAPDDGGGEVTLNAEQQAVADAFVVAFTAEGEAAAAAYAPDPVLPDLLVAAADAAANQGGAEVGAVVEAVEIAGEVATVTYTITLGGSPVAPGQIGYAVMVEGEWKVHVSTLCGVLGLIPPPPEACADVEPPAAA